MGVFFDFMSSLNKEVPAILYELSCDIYGTGRTMQDIRYNKVLTTTVSAQYKRKGWDILNRGRGDDKGYVLSPAHFAIFKKYCGGPDPVIDIREDQNRNYSPDEMIMYGKALLEERMRTGWAIKRMHGDRRGELMNKTNKRGQELQAEDKE